MRLVCIAAAAGLRDAGVPPTLMLATHCRSGSLDGERACGRPQPFWSKAQTTFFKQFDTDGDGMISYPEFLLLVSGRKEATHNLYATPVCACEHDVTLRFQHEEHVHVRSMLYGACSRLAC
jgi:hypothetical protein